MASPRGPVRGLRRARHHQGYLGRPRTGGSRPSIPAPSAAARRSTIPGSRCRCSSASPAPCTTALPSGIWVRPAALEACGAGLPTPRTAIGRWSTSGGPSDGTMPALRPHGRQDCRCSIATWNKIDDRPTLAQQSPRIGEELPEFRPPAPTRRSPRRIAKRRIDKAARGKVGGLSSARDGTLPFGHLTGKLDVLHVKCASCGR